MDPITYEQLASQNLNEAQMQGLVLILGGNPAGMTVTELEDFIVKTSHQKAGKTVPVRPTATVLGTINTSWPDGFDRWVAANLTHDQQKIVYEIMKRWSMTDVLLILGAMATTAILTAKPDAANTPTGAKTQEMSAWGWLKERMAAAGFKMS